MTNSDWNFYAYKNPYNGGVEFFLIDYRDIKPHCHTITKGKLERHEFEEFTKPKPLFAFSMTMVSAVQSLVDNLAKIGFVAEVDNKERISAQAVAEERKTELDWFKTAHIDLVKIMLIDKNKKLETQ